MNKYIVVFITAKNKTEAKKIATGLLKDKLAACVNLTQGIESMFWWKGTIDRGSEVLLIVKSKQKLFEKIVSKVKLLHSYENPEVIALPIVAGSWQYLKWIEESVV